MFLLLKMHVLNINTEVWVCKASFIAVQQAGVIGLIRCNFGSDKFPTSPSSVVLCRAWLATGVAKKAN
jgi:hypothetical protein